MSSSGTGTSTPYTNGSANASGSGTSSPYGGSVFSNAIGPVISAAAGVYGSQNNAEDQIKGISAAESTQSTAQQNINNLWAPQNAVGNNADKALNNLMTGGPGGTPDYSGFENMPGYQFAISQGTQAIDRTGAAAGNAYTPNTAINVGQYVTSTAMNDYNTYVQQLMGQANLGNEAKTQQTGAGLQTSSNISQLQQNAGISQGAGSASSAGAIQALMSNPAISAATKAALSSLFGNSGGGNSGTPNINYNPQLTNTSGSVATANQNIANTPVPTFNNPYGAGGSGGGGGGGGGNSVYYGGGAGG